MCSGVDENAVGSYAQLVFAPIDESFADDAPLLPSGFRVIPLESKPVAVKFLESYKPVYLKLVSFFSFALKCQRKK